MFLPFSLFLFIYVIYVVFISIIPYCCTIRLVVTAIQGLIDAADEQLNVRDVHKSRIDTDIETETETDLNKVSAVLGSVPEQSLKVILTLSLCLLTSKSN